MDYNTIKIKKYSDVVEEMTAHEAIYPGSLVELNGDNEVAKHATGGGNVLPMFALEDELQGRGIDYPYATGDKVQVWIPNRGDVVLGILANGEDVDEGDWLESNGAGYLRKHVADYGDSHTGTVQAALVGVVLEEMDASADSSGQDMGNGLGVNKRVRVRIL
jgi:hypothetical protein